MLRNKEEFMATQQSVLILYWSTMLYAGEMA